MVDIFHIFYVLLEAVFVCVALNVHLSHKFTMFYLVHMVPIVHVAHNHGVYFACVAHIVLNPALSNVTFLYFLKTS